MRPSRDQWNGITSTHVFSFHCSVPFSWVGWSEREGFLKDWGSPIKGRVKGEKHLSLKKESSSFPLSLTVLHNEIALSPNRTRDFHLVGFGKSLLIRTSHPSGSRLLALYQMLKHCPCPLIGPRKLSVPSRVQLMCCYKSMVTSQPLYGS